MDRLRGWRTVLSAVALAIARAGAELGWWELESGVAGALEELLIALVIVFGALKVQRFVRAQEDALDRAALLAHRRLQALDAEEAAKVEAKLSRPQRRRRARAIQKAAKSGR